VRGKGAEAVERISASFPGLYDALAARMVAEPSLPVRKELLRAIGDEPLRPNDLVATPLKLRDFTVALGDISESDASPVVKSLNPRNAPHNVHCRDPRGNVARRQQGDVPQEDEEQRG
jgi:hypothetical protein